MDGRPLYQPFMRTGTALPLISISRCEKNEMDHTPLLSRSRSGSLHLCRAEYRWPNYCTTKTFDSLRKRDWVGGCDAKYCVEALDVNRHRDT